MALTVDKQELAMSAAGANVFLRVTSSFDCRVAFKVKTSSLELYRVRPVYGFLAAKAASQLEVLRLQGLQVKEEKLVIQWAEVPPEETDPMASFKAGTDSGELIVQLKSAP